MRRLLVLTLLVGTAVAGCFGPSSSSPTPYTQLAGYVRDPTGLNATAWPKLDGVTLTVLDNGAFAWLFNASAAQFKTLTGVTLKRADGQDTEASLQTLEHSKRSGRYDLIWGVDNMDYGWAVWGGKDNLRKGTQSSDLVAYRPALANRIEPSLAFPNTTLPGTQGLWYATPVDHGYIGINTDRKDPKLNGTAITSFATLRTYADQLVVEDPRTSSPGLGFLLATIDAFGENPSYSSGRYDWHEYWKDLFRGPDRNHDGRSDGCVLVADTWTDAYVQHFSAGYGTSQGGAGDKPIVVSYSQSPADEVANGMPAVRAAMPLVANGTTYHQIQAVAIANGTKNLQAAEAFVEFTLTDYFQGLTPANDVMYPVVPSVDASSTFHHLDPAPGSFAAVQRDPASVADNLDRWMTEWAQLYQDPTVNCRLQ